MFVEKFIENLSAVTTLNKDMSEYKSKIEALRITKDELKEFNRVDGTMLERWLKIYHDNGGNVVNKNRGPKPIDEAFVDILMSNIWRTVVVRVKDTSGEDEDKFVEKIVNCCYNYESIRDGIADAKAEWLYKRPHYEPEDPGFEEEMEARRVVHDFKGCDFWIHSLLVKRSMHRRKITTSRVEAKLPDEDVILSIMGKIQALITSGNYPPHAVISADETGINWDESLKYKYVTDLEVPDDNGDQKLRFTAMLWTGADGKTGPPFVIISCSSKDSYDLKNTKVIESRFEELRQKYGDNRFELGTWERDLPFHNTKRNTTVIKKCLRRYIKDNETGAIITCQNKAWMDQIGLIMWCDLMVGPWTQAHGKKAIIIWDNFSPHLSDLVKSEFKKWGIDVTELPPNMTSLLQVVDLIINAPVKADQRRRRARLLKKYMDSFIVRVKNGEELVWNPEHISQTQGIMSLIDCITEFNSNERFMKSVANCFVKVGLMPNALGTFNKYSATTSSNMFKPEGEFVDPDRVVEVTNQDGTARRDSVDKKYKFNEVYQLVEIDTCNNDGDSPYDDDLYLGELPVGNNAGPVGNNAGPVGNNAGPVGNNVDPVAQLPTFTLDEVRNMSKTALVKALNERFPGKPYKVKSKDSASHLRNTLLQWRPTAGHAATANNNVDDAVNVTNNNVDDAVNVANNNVPVANNNAANNNANNVPVANDNAANNNANNVPVANNNAANNNAANNNVPAANNNAVANNAAVTNQAVAINNTEQLPNCYCHKPYVSDEADGPMIECANVQCPFNRWFHYKCVGKKDNWKVPDVWYCVRCKIN